MIRATINGECGHYARFILERLAADGCADAAFALDPDAPAARAAVLAARAAKEFSEGLQRAAAKRAEIYPSAGADVAPMAHGATDPQCLEPLMAFFDSVRITGRVARTARAWRVAVQSWRAAVRNVSAEQAGRLLSDRPRQLSDDEARALMRDCPLLEGVSTFYGAPLDEFGRAESAAPLTTNGLQYLAQCSNLRRLDLLSITVGGASVGDCALRALAAGCPKLEHISLPLASRNELLLMADFASLRHLLVHRASGMDAAVLSCLSSCHLHSLALGYLNGDTFSTADFTGFILAQPHLVLLRMTTCGPIGIEAVAGTCEKLDLPAIINALATNCPNLTHLALQDKRVLRHRAQDTAASWADLIDDRDTHETPYMREKLHAMAAQFPNQASVDAEMREIGLALVALSKCCSRLEHLEVPSLPAFRHLRDYQPAAGLLEEHPHFWQAPTDAPSFGRLQHLDMQGWGSAIGDTALLFLLSNAPCLRTVTMGGCFELGEQWQAFSQMLSAGELCPQLRMLDTTYWNVPWQDEHAVIDGPIPAFFYAVPLEDQVEVASGRVVAMSDSSWGGGNCVCPSGQRVENDSRPRNWHPDGLHRIPWQVQLGMHLPSGLHGGCLCDSCALLRPL